MNYCDSIVLICLISSALAQDIPTMDELRILARYTEDIGLPHKDRIRRDVSAKESPVRLGVIGGKLLDGFTAIASYLPQVNQNGRHYLPAAFSMTNQIGLQGVNSLVDDVVNYERTRALAVARDASCSQRTNCLASQNVLVARNMFGTASEERNLMRNIDCDQVFAGCQHYQ